METQEFLNIHIFIERQPEGETQKQKCKGEERNKSQPDWKEIKLSLFSNDTIIYV